jgi:hypothetical protein
MSQQGQLIRLKTAGGEPLWAYRYRVGGRESKRVQRGGFASEQDPAEALERELERLRRERRIARSLTLTELVEVLLASWAARRPMQITRNNLKTQAGAADWFSGAVYIDTVAVPIDNSRLSASSVHFTLGYSGRGRCLGGRLRECCWNVA